MRRIACMLVMLLGTACGGSRCKEVAMAREAVRADRGAVRRGPEVEVHVPFATANVFLADLLRTQPIVLGLEAPDLGPIEINRALTATVREVRLQAGAPAHVRFAIRIEVRDEVQEIATLALVTEVKPRLDRADGRAALSIGVGAEGLLAAEPELGPDGQRGLADAVARWLPVKVRDRVPPALIDAAVDKLATHLTGAAYKALQPMLARRLGEVARVRLQLPDVPVASVAIHSTETHVSVGISSDLPVRHALLAKAEPVPDAISVRIGASAAAELANWAIAQGHAPRWYSRSMQPHADGEFQPHFDYVAADAAHPLKVFMFQQRGGCSYFRVGVRASIAIRGDQLEATALDRKLEAACASPVIELAAWTKYFVTGWIDRSKRVAAATRLTVGDHRVETRVVRAELAHHELRFTLALSPLAASL